MPALSRRVIKAVALLTFIGWISYPGWFTEWYSNWPEQYAWPASLSSPKDPRWGFWFW